MKTRTGVAPNKKTRELRNLFVLVVLVSVILIALVGGALAAPRVDVQLRSCAASAPPTRTVR